MCENKVECDQINETKSSEILFIIPKHCIMKTILLSAAPASSAFFFYYIEHLLHVGSKSQRL